MKCIKFTRLLNIFILLIILDLKILINMNNQIPGHEFE